MGYTHYWANTRKKISAETKESFKNGFNAMLNHPDRPPIKIEWFDEKGIFFNGVGDDACETMVISFKANSAYQWCKTNRRPYDKMVIACLLLAYNLGIIAEWSSDGNDDELKEGYNFFEDSIKTALEVQ